MEKVNIFDAIGANKRNSLVLTVVMFAIFLAVLWAITVILDLGYFGFGLSLVLVIIYIFFAYGSGSRIILSISGARELKEGEEPFLQNVVEGLALAAGIPKPKIWVIEDEGMNAFATGISPDNAHIVFTRGILKNMKREELEGVTAHEISHIGNYDIRLATLAVVMVGAIAIVGEIALRSMFFGGERKERRSGAIAIIAILLAILAPIFAEFVRLAISRQREYLADATGAKLTRYPEGLATALEKINGHANVRSATNTTASLFIADPLSHKFAGLFATHPPIEERIKRLRAM